MNVICDAHIPEPLEYHVTPSQESGMDALDEARKEMRKLGISEQVVAELTQETLEKGIGASSPIKGDASILSGTYSGNNFRAAGGVWYWEDTVGSQCGRTRTWNYRVQPGSTVREAGRCPQGYPWFEMYCVFTRAPE
jgi:hypothetical protein